MFTFRQSSAILDSAAKSSRRRSSTIMLKDDQRKSETMCGFEYEARGVLAWKVSQSSVGRVFEILTSVSELLRSTPAASFRWRGRTHDLRASTHRTTDSSR